MDDGLIVYIRTQLTNSGSSVRFIEGKFVDGFGSAYLFTRLGGVMSPPLRMLGQICAETDFSRGVQRRASTLSFENQYRKRLTSQQLDVFQLAYDSFYDHLQDVQQKADRAS